jgi:DNA-binding transcriptional ArsR family regulator
MTNSPLDLMVRRLKALGHPARMRIAAMLRTGELCVCQITAVLQLAPSTVSAHLAELRRAGCIEERKVGRWVFYTLSDEGAILLAPLVPAPLEDARLAVDAEMVAKLRAIGPEELCRVDQDMTRLGFDLQGVRAR